VGRNPFFIKYQFLTVFWCSGYVTGKNLETSSNIIQVIQAHLACGLQYSSWKLELHYDYKTIRVKE
ncbi:MAG: hypothetical protein QME49_08390, partial [bacterium]|nr:hypothetical protein [bacterium]